MLEARTKTNFLLWQKQRGKAAALQKICLKIRRCKEEILSPWLGEGSSR